MEDFPGFMKKEMNKVPSEQQNTQDIDGYYFEGKDGSQMAFWTYYSDRESKEQTHEYTVCVAGQYTEVFDGIEHVLNPGDELLVIKGTPHHGKCIAGTRTIHAFGGKRIQND